MVCRDRLDPTPDGPVRSVVLDRVEAGSPAADAGLRKGDAVLRVGDVKVHCSYDVERAFLDRQAGEQVSVAVRRLEKEEMALLTLQSSERARPGLAELVWRKLGIRLATVSGEVISRINRQLHGGLEVTMVNADGAAARAGIRRGDILVGLHQWETVNLDNVAYVLTHPDFPSFNPLSYHIIRSGQVRRGWIQNVE
jgi:serine protease Do